MWHKIYMSEFGSQTWKPKLADCVTPKVDVAEPKDQPAGHWKRKYLKSVAGQEMNKWKRRLRDVNPSTGLPEQTESILRYGVICQTVKSL